MTPAPACRCRRTYLHLHNSTSTTKFVFYTTNLLFSSGHTNALAESIIGLFKTEAVNRHGPFKTFTEVEFALMEWADWYNNARLHSRLAYLTPAEYEAAYYSQQSPRRPALV